MTTPRMSFEDILKQNGHFIYRNVGDSMMPLIRQGKDLIVIARKPEGRLRRYDIPLFRRDSDKEAGNGKYVLHRILRVRKNDYLICGDNRWYVEKGIDDHNIVGVLTAIIRGGADPSVKDPKEIKTTDILFRIYSHIWCDLFPIRALICLGRDVVLRVTKMVRRH